MKMDVNSGDKHRFMVRSNIGIRIPNPHRAETGGELPRSIPLLTGDHQNWKQFNAEAAYADSIFQSALGVPRVPLRASSRPWTRRKTVHGRIAGIASRSFQP